MPDFGNSMEEGTLLDWKVSEGDSVTVGDILCEVETDKAVMEYESPAAGRLARIVAQNGEVVPVQQAIAYLADSDDAVVKFLNTEDVATNGSEPAVSMVAPQLPSPVPETTGSLPLETTIADGSRRVRISPAARMLAAERGIDLADLSSGSGPGDRVLAADVPSTRRANASRSESAPTQGGIRGPIAGVNRKTGSHEQHTKQDFCMRLTIDADPLLVMHRQQKTVTGCTISDLVLCGCGSALMEYPSLRRQVDGMDVLEFSNANIGLAVALDNGFVVPVVEGVEQLTLSQLAAETKRIIVNAQAGRVENAGSGVLTVQNLGQYGIEDFSTVIHPPAPAIVTIGAIREEVLVTSGTMRPGHVMTLTLSANNCVINEFVGAQFLATLKNILETSPGISDCSSV